MDVDAAGSSATVIAGDDDAPDLAAIEEHRTLRLALL
jgi:hypothetical protein